MLYCTSIPELTRVEKTIKPISYAWDDIQTTMMRLSFGLVSEKITITRSGTTIRAETAHPSGAHGFTPGS